MTAAVGMDHIGHTDRLTEARFALRSGDSVTAHSLALDMLTRRPQTAEEAREHVPVLHLLGDTLIAGGELNDARLILEDTLAVTEQLLPDDPAVRLQRSILHITLADLALQMPGLDFGKQSKELETRVYAHTSAALDLLRDHPWPTATNTARFFAYRSIMLASLSQTDSGTAAFARMQMRIQPASLQLPEYVEEYYDQAMAIADAFFEADSPTVEITALHHIPPLSAYVPQHNNF